MPGTNQSLTDFRPDTFGTEWPEVDHRNLQTTNHAIDSREKPVANADGSVDLYFGPKAPKGKESNWIQTNKGQSFFVYLRLYGPEQAYFGQTFPMTPIKKIK